MKNLKYTLQIGIATAFTLLIVIFGITLISYNYNSNKEVALAAADDIFARATREIAHSIRGLYYPAVILVDITSQLNATEGDSIEKRLDLLPYIARSIHHSQHISRVFIGYDSGDFFLVDSLQDDAMLDKSLTIPEGTSFVVTDIKRKTGSAKLSYYFYDKNLTLLESTDYEDTDFDPRSRIWYQLASENKDQIATEFYEYYEGRAIGKTFARKTVNGKGVVGIDLTINKIANEFNAQKITPSTKIIVFNDQGIALAPPKAEEQSENAKNTDEMKLQKFNIKELDDPIFKRLYQEYISGMIDGQLNLIIDDNTWIGSIKSLPTLNGKKLYLAVLAPEHEILKDIRELRNASIYISLVLLLVAVFIGWLFSRYISDSLRALSKEAENIRELKLDRPFYIESSITEVDELAITMSLMKSAIQEFIDISKALSAEKDFDKLLEQILNQAQHICNADGGSIALVDDDDENLVYSLLKNSKTGIHYGGTSSESIPFNKIYLNTDNTTTGIPGIENHLIKSGEIIVSDDIDNDSRFDFSKLRNRYEINNYSCCSILLLPLVNRQNEIIGIAELINPREKGSDKIKKFTPETISYMEALSSQAAISLDNRRLLKAQKDLLDALIQLIAGAIDAKSPYTSGHCKRVPELARMLARVADESTEKPFETFSINEDEWYELYIASWLHDCGKVTTPEYVVDKATKLECIYNRIHEIRMRFEVLWRDAQIDYYKTLIDPNQDKTLVNQELENRYKQLQEDYAFIAEFNIGSEYTEDDSIKRINEIASTSWLRHFDDRIGLSEDELRLKNQVKRTELPAKEYLLADKQEHIIKRTDKGKPYGDNPHGFNMEVPDNEFNLGEIYNLSINRGTLTAEDRYKINEHIIQTIIILSKLPLPRELKRVPIWAGNHHEKLDGTGYPRGLTGSELSIPERIMAIADIFEALTASDRPYKKAKTLSESIKIMNFMRNDGHICPALFDLFLSSGVYKEYAEAYLSPEQIDDVDIPIYLKNSDRVKIT